MTMEMRTFAVGDRVIAKAGTDWDTHGKHCDWSLIMRVGSKVIFPSIDKGNYVGRHRG